MGCPLHTRLLLFSITFVPIYCKMVVIFSVLELPYIWNVVYSYAEKNKSESFSEYKRSIQLLNLVNLATLF